jgi:hypothetical protein
MIQIQPVFSIEPKIDTNGRRFLIAFVLIALVIFGGVSVVFYLYNGSAPKSSCDNPINTGGEVGIEVVNSSSGRPIPGLPVTARDSLQFQGCPTRYFGYPIAETDANGTVYEQGLGNFTFLVIADGINFSAGAPSGAGAQGQNLNCVTLYVPSGRQVVWNPSNFSIPVPQTATQEYC